MPQDVAHKLAFGARAVRAFLASSPPLPPQSLCSRAAHAEIGAQLGSSAAFGSGCGQALPWVPRKAPLCLFTAMAVGGQKQGLQTILNYLGSVMSRLFVPGTEQPRLERCRSSIGTDELGWLTPGRIGPNVQSTWRSL